MLMNRPFIRRSEDEAEHRIECEQRVKAKVRAMPDRPREEPILGGELEATIAHEQVPAGAGERPDAPDESVGEYLRNNRLRMGKTLTDISRASKIVRHHLTAIENNAFEELPGRAYAIGFVRSYAACLGLDACPLVARLKAELTEADTTPVFVSPNPPARRNQTGTESLANGDAHDFLAERRPPLQQRWLFGAAPKALQLHAARLVLRITEIAKIARELDLDFPSRADRGNRPGVAPAGHGDDSEPEFGLFTTPNRRDETRTAYTGHGNARRPDVALFSRPPVKAAPLFSASGRSLPLPSPAGHPMRTWLTAGLMTAVMMYFGYSMMHSGLRPAPPMVVPVPTRLAAEAGLTPDMIAPPAVAIPEQPASAPPQPVRIPPATDGSQPVGIVKQPPRNPPASALAPPVNDVPRAVAAIENSGRSPHEAAVEPPGDALPAQLDSAGAEAKHIFHGQLPLGERYGEQNRGSRVTLRVHRATFVAVLGVRNHQYIDRVLRAGDTYRVPNMRGLKLNARDAGAVEVILDGNTVGFAGSDGAAVKGMSLQPQSIVSRFHWLQE